MRYLFIFLSLSFYTSFVNAHGQQPSEEDKPSLQWQLEGMMSLGTSSAETDELTALQSGAHDPQETGFNLQNVELSVDFIVDSKTKFSAGLQADDEEFGLEHLYLETTFYAPLTAKIGYFAADFGLLNAHHTENWLDYPVINARLLGGEGTMGTGLQLAAKLPVNWHSQLSFAVQNANDETAVSFLGEGHSHDEEESATHTHVDTTAYPFYDGVGGTPIVRTHSNKIKDLLYTLRFNNQWQVLPQLALDWGLSGMIGANRAGESSKTYLIGTDLTLHWQLNQQQRVIWQTEWMQRHFEVGAYQDNSITIQENTLKDWGFYSQVLYQFHPQWAAGIRYDYASGDKALFSGQRAQDNLRSDRFRISPLLTWSPLEQIALHLQYNYDDADFMTENAHTVWLGLSWQLGADHDD